MNRLDSFKIFKLPLLVGVSRKGMVWKTLGISPEEALNGTTVLNTLALLGNADILRVHDVKEAVQTIKIVEQLRECSKNE
jgi:dihydropteroate synthase